MDIQEFEEINEQIKENERYTDAFRGCLIGGAVGDALGYAIEFCKAEEIFSQYGQEGISHYELFHGKALISDDTQMTLFTATGLLLGKTRSMTRGISGNPWIYPGFAYKTWYRMQMGENARDEQGYSYSWLADVPEMGARRAPGNTCLSAIVGNVYGTTTDPINSSKGCGGIMRVAPVGLYFNRKPSETDRIAEVNEVAAEVAALTHGHELGWMPAAALAHIINRVTFSKMSLLEAIKDSVVFLQRNYSDRKHLKELVSIMEFAIELSMNHAGDQDNINRLGEGWVAEETLAIAIYCSLKYQNDFSKAIRVAVNHSGDSDSTGAVTGNILGAIMGYEKIPEEWKKNLECRDVILEVADDLCRDCHISEYGRYSDRDWERKYIENKWHETVE